MKSKTKKAFRMLSIKLKICYQDVTNNYKLTPSSCLYTCWLQQALSKPFFLSPVICPSYAHPTYTPILSGVMHNMRYDRCDLF